MMPVDTLRPRNRPAMKLLFLSPTAVILGDRPQISKLGKKDEGIGGVQKYKFVCYNDFMKRVRISGGHLMQRPGVIYEHR
jgi:hypothetical protein